MTDWQGGSLVEFYRALLQCTSSSSYHRPRDTDPWKGGSSRDSCRPPHLGWPGGWGLLPPWRLEGRACPAAFSPLPTLEGARRSQPPDVPPSVVSCGASLPSGGLPSVRLHPRPCGHRARTADSQGDLGEETDRFGGREKWGEEGRPNTA